MNVTRNRGLYGSAGRAAAVAVVVVLWLCVAVPGLAAEDEAVTREYEVKAAFLYNFATFIEWPKGAVPDAGDTFVIGVFGEDPFGAVLDAIAASKTVQGKRIVVRRFTAIEDYMPCHILFVARSEHKRLAEILERLAGAPVLIVGENAGFAETGGIVNLVIEDNKVRFEINQNAAQRAGLKISSKLLRLARIVEDKAVTGESLASYAVRYAERDRHVGVFREAQGTVAAEAGITVRS